MEQAQWIDWRQPRFPAARADRFYFGHETCQRLLPPPRRACELARLCADRGAEVTLVAPFLTNAGLDDARRLIDRMLGAIERLEVACADWGLLGDLIRRRVCTPVVGRLLAGQHTDPRMIRIFQAAGGAAPPDRRVRHVDGSACLLRHRPPPPALARHLRSCCLDRPRVIRFLTAQGVSRCEISNTGQGIELAGAVGWTFSLHVPDVPVAVSRWCLGAGEDFTAPPRCDAGCDGAEVPWRLDSLPVALFRRDNAVYYRWDRMPENLASLPIDRIVLRRG